MIFAHVGVLEICMRGMFGIAMGCPRNKRCMPFRGLGSCV